MKKKRAFLMAESRSIPNRVELGSSYDEMEQVNVEHIGGLLRPVALNPSVSQTGSKTMSAPGDDDPDPEDERCY